MYPLLGVLGETAVQEDREHRRDASWQRIPVGLPFDHSRQCRGHIVPGEWLPAGEHLVENRTKRPDVRALVDGLALGLLRRHIRGGPDHHAHLCCRGRQTDRRRHRHVRVDRVRLERLGQAKVQHLDGPVLPHLDVCGLQIAVDDTRLVCGLQRLGDLLSDGERVIQRERSLADPLSQGRSFDQLEYQRTNARLP